MKAFTNENYEQYSYTSLTAGDDHDEDDMLWIENSEKFNIACRKLTSIDVDQALYTLNTNQNLSQQPTHSSDFEPEYDCCRLRRLHNSSRLSLPLARRGRSFFSKRPHRSLCSNCTKLKDQQEIDILRSQQEKLNSNGSYQITINLDRSPDKEIASSNEQYQSRQAIIWNINASDRNNTNINYDTGSLNENEKKVLLDETIKKLQLILNSQSTTVAENNQQNSDVTCRILQTTISILSSSQNST